MIGVFIAKDRGVDIAWVPGKLVLRLNALGLTGVVVSLAALENLPIVVVEMGARIK